jgi:hypothetical protein
MIALSPAQDVAAAPPRAFEACQQWDKRGAGRPQLAPSAQVRLRIEPGCAKGPHAAIVGHVARDGYGSCMIDVPLPFRGRPPARDEWVLAQSLSFSAEKWRAALPDPALWPPELDHLPETDDGRPLIDRRTVFRIGERAAEPRGAAQTLVAASVWGTGTAARGRSRRLRVFEQAADAICDHLAIAVEILRSKGPIEAFIYLHGDGRNLIKHLGPSFGTKVLYFCGYGSSSGDRSPLILDQYVTVALNKLCGLNWPEQSFSSSQYDEYLDLAHRWASDWHTSPDVIERVLFSVGKASPLVIGVLAGLPLYT